MNDYNTITVRLKKEFAYSLKPGDLITADMLELPQDPLVEKVAQYIYLKSRQNYSHRPDHFTELSGVFPDGLRKEARKLIHMIKEEDY